MIERGAGIIGTPDDAIAQIERLEQKIPNFGAYLMLAHNWANFEDTKRSYALFAQHVKPHFNRANTARAESLQWAADNSDTFMGAAMGAAAKTIEKYQREEAEKAQKKAS
jgi:limonene 1,2-monooxygenase